MHVVDRYSDRITVPCDVEALGESLEARLWCLLWHNGCRRYNRSHRRYINRLKEEMTVDERMYV